MNNSLKSAIYLKELGRLKESISMLKKYIKKSPLDIEAFFHLIHAFTLNSQTKEAWQYLKKAEKIGKDNTTLLAYKARIFLKEKRYKEAFDIIQGAYNLDNNNGFILLTFANILGAINMHKEAKDALDMAIKVSPNLAEAYALRARYFNKDGDRESALMYAKKALLKKPHLKVLESITDANNYLEAIELIKEVLKEIPLKKSIILLNLLGDYQYKVNDKDAALDTFKKILKMVPNSIDIKMKIANILTEISDYNSAIKIYKEIESYNINKFKLYNNLALCYKQKGYYNDSEKYYQKAIKLNSYDSHLFINYALMKIDDEKYDEAINIIKRALQKNNNEPELLTTLGFCYIKADKFNEALEILKKALKIGKNKEKIYYLLGQTYIELGELDISLNFFNNVLDLYLEALNKAKILKPPVSSKYMDTNNAKEVLKKIYKAFKDKSIDIFLSSGTLLGIVRDGDLLPYDKDIDIGVDWEVSREIVEETLSELNFRILKLSYKEKEWLVTGANRELGVTVDVFFYKKLDKKVVCGFYGKPYPIML